MRAISFLGENRQNHDFDERMTILAIRTRCVHEFPWTQHTVNQPFPRF